MAQLLRAILLATMVTAFPVKADHLLSDYLLEVWERNVPRSQPPLKSKVFIAYSDCAKERQWLLGLFYSLDMHEKIWITCDYIGEHE